MQDQSSPQCIKSMDPSQGQPAGGDATSRLERKLPGSRLREAIGHSIDRDGLTEVQYLAKMPEARLQVL